MTEEKTPHPAAHLLRAIADGEQMQALGSHKPTEWQDCLPAHAIRMLGTEYDSAPDDVVRVKKSPPAVIYINGGCNAILVSMHIQRCSRRQVVGR